jgi:biotin carboxyl carrier protein
MAHAYTPGLKVTPRTRYRARRILPIAGDVLVKAGDRVQARDVVARTELPGDVTPINLANLLALPPGDVPGCLLKREGDRIEVGEPLARTKGIFGMFKNEYAAKTAGTIESVSNVTGQVIVRGAPIPVEVRAYATGEVVEVLPGEGCIVEADAALVQGIFGIGGEAYGVIRMACADHAQELTPDLIGPDMRGAIVIGGARVTGEAVRRAIAVGAAAVVSGGIDDQDLRDVLGYDLGVAITGTEQIGITLIVTEGFGEIAMAERTFKLLAAHAGAEAAVNGATQIRAGVMRPEIVIPLAAAGTTSDVTTGVMAAPLEVGSPVRIIRDPHFGIIGTVAALPPEPHVLDSGSKARVLEVESADGRRLTVPRANVEIIGG